MRLLSVLFVLLAPAFAVAQTPAEKTATLKFISSLYDPATGGYKVTAEGKPSLRACNGAARAVKYLGGELPDRAKTAAFVMDSYDLATGGFAEPGGKPDVAMTSVGVMAAVELGVPREKFAKAMDYLKANAKTFEDVRIGAAAVEAWGVKECPFDLAAWREVVGKTDDANAPLPKNGGARAFGSIAAFYLRLGMELAPPKTAQNVLFILRDGQRDDGGWGQYEAKTSDAETTYRVMRTFHLLKERPTDVKKVREFLAKCRNADGGYGVKPGEASTMSGVYYASIIGHWLDELEKR